ncbi:hypothetical protein [Hydrogenophaga flava]|uniref:hypothetical protein n=1 Tax=Hydrogenophaga flava TaxID=65657 RepID=UPI000826789C|nr:hypothetical protein [Hydrogenophaga flava]
MRYLSTPDEIVEHLKKQAKKLQRSGAGKHSDLLNRVAKQAGYDHWHHVVKCNENAKAVAQMRAIRDMCEVIIAAELRGVAKALVTSNGVACPPFVLFSTGIGDAWLLEPDEALAMCMVWQGKRQTIGLHEDPERLEVEWDCTYELLGDFFNVESLHPIIGTRSIGGYPLKEVRMLLDQAQSPMMKMAAVIGQVDALEITPEVVVQMAKQGWSESELMRMKAEGWHYSPSRNSLLGPVMTEDDFDLDDENEPPEH